MKRTIIAFIALSLLLSACVYPNDVTFSSTIIEGSGNVVREERPVMGITEVNLNGFGDLIIMQGEKEELVIEADDNILSYLTTEMHGPRLDIGVKSSYSLKSIKTIRYYLTVRDLNAVRISGFGDVEIADLETPSLEIRLSGTGDIDLRDLQSDSLKVTISGFGNATVTGEVIRQEVVLSGSGNYTASDLKSRETRIRISGFGNSELWVTDELDVTISGSGDLEYYGSPHIQQSMSGFGSINSRGEK